MGEHGRRLVLLTAGALIATPAGVAVEGATAAAGSAGSAATSLDLGTDEELGRRAGGHDGVAGLDRRFDLRRKVPVTAAQRRADRRLGIRIQVAWNRSGTARSIVPVRRTVTGPARGAADTVARRFLRAHRDLFGLAPSAVRDLRLTMRDTEHGVTYLRYQQIAGGIDVYGATGLVVVDRRGRILRAGGDFVRGAGDAGAAVVSAERAVDTAAGRVDRSRHAIRPLPGGRRVHRFRNTVRVPDYRRAAPLTARRVVVGTDRGARPAWLLHLERAANADYQALVDARSGRLLLLRNLVSSDAQGTVFPGDDPEAGGRTQLTLPAGWVDDDTTAGNNTVTYQDAEGDNAADGDGSDQPQDDDGHFNYAWADPWGSSATGAEADLPLTGADRDAVVTQLFYYTNWYHDYAYGLGFTETARNFQEDNFGNGGSGGDPVEAESDANFLGDQCDDEGTPVKCLNNANFHTGGADGSTPRMQMFVGDTNPGGAARRTQRANNRDTVIHEYSHGISGRIISDGNLSGGIQSRSLGEGWSDALATSINDDPVYGEYNNGDYTGGIRGVAYDADSLEYGDFAGSSEHTNGRIWAMSLWETRAALIDKYGAADGRALHERLIVTGMKNTMDTPSFHDARSGYLAADAILKPTGTPGVGADWCRLWAVFADNELGVTASPDDDTDNSGSLTVSTDTPAECSPDAVIAPVADQPEGADIGFDGSASAVGGDLADTLTYAWDLDDDGAFDDSTSATPVWAYGDDASRTVRLQVTNSSGYTDTASVTFRTTNVAPTVTLDLSDLAGMEENQTRTVAGTFTDPGWLDGYAGSVSLGTPYRPDVPADVAVTTQGGRGPGDAGGATPDTGSAVAEVTYGDDGAYTVTLSITDDDAGTGAEDGIATVANVAPTAVIDTSGEQVYDGVSAFVVEAGEPLTVPASSQDPGSDDVTFRWDWDGPLNGETPTEETSLNEPPGTDPALSPSINPRSVDLEATHAYADACRYDLELTVTDDDAGVGADAAVVLITGTADKSRAHGWWLNQYRVHPGNDFTAEQLQCYLDIVGYLSMVFDEANDAGTREQAARVLNDPPKPNPTTRFDQAALAAWLNVANGSVRLDTPVTVAGVPTTFGEAMLAAETTRLDSLSTPAQRRAATAAAKKLMQAQE